VEVPLATHDVYGDDDAEADDDDHDYDDSF